MSGSPTTEGPSPAYCEEVNEDSQTPIPGSKQTANTAAKRSKEVKKSKRDAASDSGYSSHTAATAGSSSQESNNRSAPKGGLVRRGLQKMTGGLKKTQTKEVLPPPKTQARKPIARTQKKDNLRGNPEACEGREAAARIKLSGAPVASSKPQEVHQHPPKGRASQSPTKPVLATQSTARPIPILQHPSTVRVRNSTSNSRPASYHAGAPWPQGYIVTTPPIYRHPPQQPTFSLPTPTFYPPPHNGITPFVSNPLPSSPNRQTSYPFPATTPQNYPPLQWHPDGYHPQPLSSSYGGIPISRSHSLHSPSHASPVVEYPSVPVAYNTRPRVSQDYVARRRSVSSADQIPVVPSPVDDEAVYFDEEDNEAYYRRVMPPPPRPPHQRPKMHHSATTSSAVPKRPDRDSVGVVIPHSPRHRSFEEPRPATRPPTSYRMPSVKNVSRVPEAPVSPSAVRRRSRPVSYHAGSDPAKQAEEYQASQKAQTGKIALTTDAIKQVNKAGQSVKTGKSKSKGGSETNSRASSSRDGSGALKRRSMDRHRHGMQDDVLINIETAEGMRINVKGGESTDGRRIRFRQGHDGEGSMDVSIENLEDSKSRDGRLREREPALVLERRQSVSSRGGEVRKIKEYGESEAGSRRRSSSRPVTSRQDAQDPSHEEVRRRLESIRVEAASQKQDMPVEDDEEGKGTNYADEKTLEERWSKLRPRSQSRRSSRSTVSRRSMNIRPPPVPAGGEGEPF